MAFHLTKRIDSPSPPARLQQAPSQASRQYHQTRTQHEVNTKNYKRTDKTNLLQGNYDKHFISWALINYKINWSNKISTVLIKNTFYVNYSVHSVLFWFKIFAFDVLRKHGVWQLSLGKRTTYYPEITRRTYFLYFSLSALLLLD